MANKLLTVTTTFAYLDESAKAQTKTSTVSVPFLAAVSGELDVPEAENSGTEHVIPFGSVAKATAVWVKNKTDQELELTVNGSDPLNSLPVNGELLICMPGLGLADDLTAVSLTTTATVGAAGTIAFRVFGDPV